MEEEVIPARAACAHRARVLCEILCACVYGICLGLSHVGRVLLAVGHSAAAVRFIRISDLLIVAASGVPQDLPLMGIARFLGSNVAVFGEAE